MEDLLPGGSGGAYVVRADDGWRGLASWCPPRPAGAEPGGLDRALDLAERARRAGLPVPAQRVLGLADGDAVVLQERMPGRAVGVVTDALVDHLLELGELRRGLLAGTRWERDVTRLHLRDDGPGYCLHGPLADHPDPRAGHLLDLVHRVGSGPLGDDLVGPDLLHWDLHLENVLVADDDPGQVTAVVDWDGARGGELGFDLALLVLDLRFRDAPAGLVERVAARHRELSDVAHRARHHAHLGLRIVDWAIRHEKPSVPRWLDLALDELAPLVVELA